MMKESCFSAPNQIKTNVESARQLQRGLQAPQPCGGNPSSGNSEASLPRQRFSSTPIGRERVLISERPGAIEVQGSYSSRHGFPRCLPLLHESGRRSRSYRSGRFRPVATGTTELSSGACPARPYASMNTFKKTVQACADGLLVSLSLPRGQGSSSERFPAPGRPRPA